MNPPTKAVQLAVERGEAYYDPEQADRIIRFALSYVVPQFVKGEFHLLPWQEHWLKNLYGWRNQQGGKLFKRALLHIAKKNGKTLLASIVCLFELYNQDTPSPLVASASTTRKNASQIFDQIAHTIRQSKPLTKLAKITPSNKTIRLQTRNARYWSLSADAPSSEGENLVAVVIDECHAHKSDKLYRALEYSTVARPDSILVFISTAGNDLSHWYYSLYTKAKRCLSGDDLDPHFFPTVFEIPDEADVEQPDQWSKANPSLGTSFTPEAFRADLLAAKSDTASWLSFMRYRLNRFVAGSDEAAFDVLKWDACKQVKSDDLKLCPCYLGVDLSQSIDPSSVSAVWVLPEKRYHVKSWAWVAEEGVAKREARNLPRYQQFVYEQSMTITSGDMIDIVPIKAKILELASMFQVRAVVFDQYSAYILANEVSQTGLPVWRNPQSFKYMSAPIKELSQAILERRVTHDGNAWLRWCVQCARLETNSFGDCRIHRDKSRDHVDGIIACVMALGQGMNEQAPFPRKSRYDEIGLDFV